MNWDNNSDTEDADDLLEEAERRFHKASFYKEIIKNDIFSGSDEIGQEVEAEFKTWARQRLAELLGLSQPKPDVDAVFSADQILALKRIADNLLQKPSLIQKMEPPPQPKPEIAKIQAPQPQRHQESPKPTQVAAKRGPKPKPKPEAVEKPASSERPADGDIVKEDGRVYKVTWREIPSPESVSPMFKPFVDNGKAYYIVKSDITKPADDPSRVPMPQGAQFTLVTQNKAFEAERFAPSSIDAKGLAKVADNKLNPNPS